MLYRKRKNGKPHGNWLYDFRLQGDRFHGTTGTTDKALARSIEARKRDEALKSLHLGIRPDMTLDLAAGRYWSEVAEHQRSSATTEYQLANIIRLLGKGTLLRKIDDDSIAAMIAKRRGEKSRRGGRIGNSSVNREMQVLKRLHRRARNVWRIAVQEIDWSQHVLREPPPPNRPLSEDEERRLMTCAAPHLRPAIQFALLTGVRLENTVRLDWSQIDLNARQMRFIVKGGKHHVLPVTDALQALLAALGPQVAGPVFTYKGAAIKTWKTAWRAALRRAGIEGFRWHDLRHTVGSRLVREGVDISVVQEILGHADIHTTRRYVHHAPGAKKDALSRLESRDIPASRRREKRKALKS